jgi:hypothetical protein
MSLGRYALIVLGLVAGTLALAWPPLLSRLDVRGRWAAVFGGGVAAANALAAYFLVVWSQKKSTSVFMGAVLGGMVGRMALMLAAVVAAVLALGLPKVPLVVSLLGYFVVLLALELAVVHRRTTPEAR